MSRRNVTNTSTSNDDATFNIDHGNSVITNTSQTKIDWSYKGRILVTQENYLERLGGDIDVDATYIIRGSVDIGSLEIEVPLTGIRMSRELHNVESKIYSTQDNYTMFKSQSQEIGSGDIRLDNITITTSGVDSQVYSLYDANYNYAIENYRVNYEDCTSIGKVYDYRDISEDECESNTYSRLEWEVNNI
tara:strand:+ start:791 stop:1360 length:570 start_codon:yes stop_codon:yes gene_type:complete